jgi:DNA repair ATPase RecN
MKINLISQDEHKFLLDTFDKHPNLIYQNKGYDCLNWGKLTKEDRQVHKQVTELLKKTVVGFIKFNHFKLNNKGEKQIRLQYNYGAADNSMPFTGVGYVLIDELLNGFN